jgi:hypothetical protein
MEILAELRSLKNMDIKPNYSDLSRRCKVTGTPSRRCTSR